MYNSGIDKIKLILNPAFLNNDRPKYIKSNNALTLHNAGCFTFLAIHSEYFNPFIDYKLQIAKAIYELIEKKVINFQNDYPILTLMIIWQYMNCFILGVSQVEFYFDFPKGKVSVESTPIKNDDIIQYMDKDGIFHETFYSNDYEPGKRKSSFCVYNKYFKLIHDRHLSYKAIDEMNVEYRIEARLSRENCPYLDLYNLSRTYEDIFKRFKSFLAIQYYNYLYGFIEVTGKSNTYFARLLREADKEKTKYFNRNRLMKSEPIQNTTEQNSQLKNELLEKYYQDINNEKTTMNIDVNDIETMDLDDC